MSITSLTARLNTPPPLNAITAAATSAAHPSAAAYPGPPTTAIEMPTNAAADVMASERDMGWMSAENLPRFLVYRCSSISRIEKDGTQRLGIGLLAEQATGNVLPEGDVSFTYCLLQRPLTRLLTEQEAVRRWMEALLPLF